MNNRDKNLAQKFAEAIAKGEDRVSKSSSNSKCSYRALQLGPDGDFKYEYSASLMKRLKPAPEELTGKIPISAILLASTFAKRVTKPKAGKVTMGKEDAPEIDIPTEVKKKGYVLLKGVRNSDTKSKC